MPVPSVATNPDQRRALATLLRHVQESWTTIFSTPPSDEEIRRLLRVLVVDVLDLEDGGTDRATVAAHLRAVLLDPQRDDLAWMRLTDLGHRISERREWRRRLDVAAELDAVGAPVGPGRRHAADVARLRRVSEANLDSLREHSGLPLRQGLVHCDRAAIGDLAGLEGNLVIVGDPGCGKSGVLCELASRLATAEDVLVLTVDGLPESAGAARIELGLGAELLETLKEWSGAGRATLFLDGLDAARGEGTTWLARLCGALPGTRWRVIATMRRFDMERHLAWQRVFRDDAGSSGARNVAPELAHVRHYLLGDLSDDDLAHLATASPTVAEVLDGVPGRMLDLVRNPFNLRLAVELVEAGASVTSLAETRDQLHLLQRYWQLRVVNAPGGSSRVRALEALTAEMLSSRRLRVDASVVPDAVIPAADELLHDGVLHEAAAPLLARGAAVLVYSHHILFDFAVAALVFTATGESRLVALLDENPNLAVVARPSIDLHLTDLWHAEARRSMFSTTARELANQNHSLAGIAAALVTAENVRNRADVEWLVEELGKHPELATTFVHWLCGVLDAADPELVARISDALSVWADLTTHLADAVERQFAPAIAQALFRMLFQLHKLDPLTWSSGGATARASSASRLLAICLDEPGDRAWLAARAAQLLPRAIAVDNRHAAALRSVTENLEVLDAVGPDVIRHLVDGIEMIADGDPDAAAAVLSAVWRWNEDRDEPTHLTQGVLTLTSTRKQDVNHVKWLSGEKFAEFIPKAGLLRSVAVIADILSAHVEQYQGIAREEIRAFGVVGQVAPMAHELKYGPGHGAAVKIVDALMTALETQPLRETEVIEVVKAMVSSIAHPEFWRKLLLTAAELPAWQIPVARVLSSGALLVNGETRAAAGKLMSELTNKLDGTDHEELLEVPIQRAAALFPENSGEWRDRAVDQLLGRLDVSRVQHPDLRSRLTNLLAEDDLPEISKPARVEVSYEPLSLRDVLGAEVHDSLAEAEKDAFNALQEAFSAAENDATERAVSDLARALEQAGEAEGKAEPVRELITRAAESLARDPAVRPGTQIGELVARILIDGAGGD